MNRLLILALLNGLLALVLGFFAIPGQQALWLIKHLGYWAMLGTAGLFAWLLLRVIRRTERTGWKDWADWKPAAAVPAGWLVLLLHEPFGFKVIMDEIMLLGTSMSMHFDKLVQVPYRGHDIQGAFIIVEGLIDKRPLFFPFLLSGVHDVLGYRPENAFWLNAVLAFALLALVYLLGRRLAGAAAGVAGVLLLTGLPLLAQNANGGGFELLNLLMIALTLWLGLRFVETREAPELSAFCVAGVLLAQTRYESALFILPVVLLILWVWWRERRLILSWTLAFTPLLLLPVPLLQKIFQLNQEAWQMFSKPGVEKPFGLEYVWINLAHAWGYFFDTTGGQPNSLLLSVLGLFSVGFLLLLLVRMLPRLREAAPARVVVMLFSLGLLGLFALLMGYFWGKFDDPVITRLSLPLHFLFVLALWLVVPELPRPGRVWWVLNLAALLQLWGLSIPSMSSHAYTLNYVHGREVEWRREFIREHPARDYLVLDANSIVWITHLVSSTPPLQARLRKNSIIFHRRNHSFSEIYAFQRFDLDPETGRMKLVEDYDLGPDYQLETVTERRLHPYTLSRISRVVAIRDSVEPAPKPAAAADGALSPAKKEELKKAYWDNWLRNLP